MIFIFNISLISYHQFYESDTFMKTLIYQSFLNTPDLLVHHLMDFVLKYKKPNDGPLTMYQ